MLISRESLSVAVVVAVLLSTVPLTAAHESAILGKVLSTGVEVDGIEVPSGTTLLAPTSLRTTSSPASIHLSGRRVLRMAQESQARFESQPSGGVQVAVLAGALSYLDGGGEVVTLGRDDTALLDQEEIVGEGMRISEEEPTVEMCELQKTDDPAKVAECLADPSSDGCDWETINPSYSQVDGLLDHSVFASVEGLDDYFTAQGTSPDDELVVFDCDEAAAAALIAAGAVAGGLGAAGIAGIAVGSALGIVLIDDAISDDQAEVILVPEEVVASPTN